MGLKARLARIAARVERGVDRFRRPRRQVGVVETYVGYATPDHLIVRGRVLSTVVSSKPSETQGRWTNVRQMARLFLTSEVSDVEVRCRDVVSRTDEEGYFHLSVPRDDEVGWVPLPVSVADYSANCDVRVPDPHADFGVISDIDDTMMETGAYSLGRNLWTSLTGNALTRRIFPDAIALMDVLGEGDRNPIFFVSSSPWNLYGFLRDVIGRAGLPRAPMFLRDYGISETQFITGTHGDHKSSAIDEVMDANPGLSFVLVGDTGQHDATVYLEAVKRHPGRVRTVILRVPKAGSNADDLDDINAIKALGIQTFVGPDYADAIAALRS